MVATNVVKILHLVDSDNPILTRKGLLDCVQDWPNLGQADVADAVGCLALREEVVVVVIGHFVPVSFVSM